MATRTGSFIAFSSSSAGSKAFEGASSLPDIHISARVLMLQRSVKRDKVKVCSMKVLEPEGGQNLPRAVWVGTRGKGLFSLERVRLLQHFQWFLTLSFKR
ncbi:MAG: hypothetical protein H7095_02160 [Pseudopedobacter sp.]|nr:hypothetical protein [Deinococcales bacterium]